MVFILLVFLSALLLEGIGTIISVMGLTQLFGINYFIISLAVAFDFAKLVAVSFLYKEWKSLPKLLAGYLTIASFVLMMITSTGAAGYLSSTFQKAILPTKSIDIQVKANSEEKLKLEARKKEIDSQIANLPPDMVKGRTKLIANFKTEIDRVNNRIVELDQELPKLQTEQIEKSSHAGPITYIATALNTTAEKAMGYLIGLIIFVFDPLAIALILAGNYLVAKPKVNKKEKIKELIREEAELLTPALEPIIEERELPTETSVDWDDFFVGSPNPLPEPTPEQLQEVEDYINERKAIIDREHEANMPLEDQPETFVEEEEDRFYPYFSPDVVALARAVAEEQAKIKPSQSSLDLISDVADVSFDDNNTSNVKHAVYDVAQ